VNTGFTIKIIVLRWKQF